MSNNKIMKQIFSMLSSTRLMAVLFIVYAAVLGIGTFIENEYNTDTARMVVYNAKWFEVIMVLFVINFIGNIKRYRLLSKEKWATLILHLAFILIIVGAGITRYISFEGVMPIREGESSNQILSDRTFVTVWVDGELDGEMKRLAFEQPVYFSAALNKDNLVSNFASNSYKLHNTFNNIPFEIDYKDFIMGAHETFVQDANGKWFLKLVESSEGERHDHYIEEGTVEMIHNVLYAFNQPTQGAINFTMRDGQMYIQSPFDGNYLVMATQQNGTIPANVEQPLNYRSMYNFQGIQFVTDTPERGKKALVSTNDFKDTKNPDALVLSVKSQGKEEIVTLKGSKGAMGQPQSVKVGDLEFTLMYGSKTYETPFQIKLNDFIADKHPGTMNSYKSFESKVTVIDGKDSFDARIYMNNVLDYKGYRFFQAQFDPDEKGTILSVNHDFIGTWTTYIGYTLLYIGLIGILFTKGTRFTELKKKLDNVKKKKSLLGLLLFLFTSITFAQHNHEHENHNGHNHNQQQNQSAIHHKPSEKEVLEAIDKIKIDAKHAEKFGSLVIQDASGRMKPLNTFTSELLRKVSQEETFNKLNSDQVFLSMRMFPQVWHHAPIIKLKRGNDSLRSTLGLPKDAEYASFMDFIEPNGAYKLTEILDVANHKAVKNQFDKDFIEIDKRVILMSQALMGSIMKIFPVPNDKTNKWISTLELMEMDSTALDSETRNFIKNILPYYYESLLEASKTNNYQNADNILESLSAYQNKYGYEVIPSKDQIKAEILYNKGDVFKRLFSWYIYASVLFFIVCIVRIFKDSEFVKMLTYSLTNVIIAFFLLHTLGLIARWYVSGHAPWSDAYESMIYVGWATMLFGLIFGRKSELTIASTAFVTGMILMIAHWNWMDPNIANLQPVLDSYWLMIHVSIIVGSYGPFALGMILGIVALILMIFTTNNNKSKMDLHIKEITYINEMALTIGLVMLTIGNFLGGQWANESWGRYWGWDPKETWALVSIMVYAFVIHMRFVPALRGSWIYNVCSVFAFYAILMTYFGVNFYLSGLHSYAKGDQVVTPNFIWWSVGIVSTISAIAYVKYKNHLKK